MTCVRFLVLAAFSCLSGFAQPTISGVLNGASFSKHLSPGALATVFGSDLSGTNLVVTLDSIDCPVVFSSATQLNIQLPWEATTGAGNVVVSHDGLSSAPFGVKLGTYSPALFSSDGSGGGAGEFFSGSQLISSSNKANGGDTLTTFGVGFGATSPAIATGETTPDPPPLYVTLTTPTATVGGKKAAVRFSGLAPGVLATDQLNFTLAPFTPVGNRSVVFQIGGLDSPPLTIPVGCKEVNSIVTITKGQIHHISGNKYRQGVEIKNTSTTSLPETGSIILTSLTSSAKLTNGGGSTCRPSDGVSPYIDVTFTGSGTSQTATVTLDFTDATTSDITYGVRVLVP